MLKIHRITNQDEDVADDPTRDDDKNLREMIQQIAIVWLGIIGTAVVIWFVYS